MNGTIKVITETENVIFFPCAQYCPSRTVDNELITTEQDYFDEKGIACKIMNIVQQ